VIKIIPLAIPIFFALIAVEVVVARLQGRSDYLRFNDAVTAISCGIGSQVAKVFLGVLTVVTYAWVYAVAEPRWSAWLPIDPLSPWMWIAAALLVDHQYYWWHRHSHRINFMWAAHVVHHHSQEYNLAVALRQAMFTSITSLPYYLPLALLGVPPAVFLLSIAANTLYQFWIHTRTVGRLGPLEWVLNTPSHHRVHHGVNPSYIDRNHAGVLIVWDRLYGTFAPEREEPVYGTVQPLESFDPIWANFAYWGTMLDMARRAPRVRDRLWVWFAPPEWSPEGVKEIPSVDAATFAKWDVALAPGLAAYVLTHFAVVGTAGTVWILWMEDEAALGWLAVLGASILWATWSWGQLFHRRARGAYSEVARNLALPPTLAFLLAGTAWQLPAVAAATALGLASIVTIATRRDRWVDRGARLKPAIG
jgi:sterol desaturase/sphingolipid hydroxylase (fatty acid hydroxylase superfamily)